MFFPVRAVVAMHIHTQKSRRTCAKLPSNIVFVAPHQLNHLGPESVSTPTIVMCFCQSTKSVETSSSSRQMYILSAYMFINLDEAVIST